MESKDAEFLQMGILWATNGQLRNSGVRNSHIYCLRSTGGRDGNTSGKAGMRKAQSQQWNPLEMWKTALGWEEGWGMVTERGIVLSEWNPTPAPRSAKSWRIGVRTTLPPGLPSQGMIINGIRTLQSVWEINGNLGDFRAGRWMLFPFF